MQVDLPIIINVDNVGAICLSEKASSSQRTRHIDIRVHFVREFVEDGVLPDSNSAYAENPVTREVNGKHNFFGISKKLGRTKIGAATFTNSYHKKAYMVSAERVWSKARGNVDFTAGLGMSSGYSKWNCELYVKGACLVPMIGISGTFKNGLTQSVRVFGNALVITTSIKF